ncbi:pseudaminic acid cytidylyltransferase [Thiosulfativibrio zosterae]|uniref:Pseudaminic acid cytidylyltransferase n=1 Tax=Thiosulfativibrio zosterae TaxID=2675053 RepID=A0A6F8PLX3_9GAMM|nr:pseudaminic acid cytidylyltransferase [Thiosulfativibrio zosterae]BBP43085.1 pseudaminic acid cytidylyltransferase [Thiosulfativibrio zosterae]
MKIAIIPARGGSKRIPRKNIKDFCGKPIIAYPIQAALESELFDQVVVSTDDDGIVEVAKSFGAKLPFKRPKSLADDHAATAPVIIHAIEWYESQGVEIEEVCFLYPCTPFVTAKLLQSAYAEWKSSDAAYCFSVCEFASAPQRALKLNNDGRLESLYPQYRGARTQDLDRAFFDAGQFYFVNPDVYKKRTPIHSPASLPYIIPKYLAHDIDTLADWQLAEMFYRFLQNENING